MAVEGVVDNDFVGHLAEIDWELPELENLIKRFFEEIRVFPIMHELVYKNELDGGAETNVRDRALSFFDDNIIIVKEVASFLDSPVKKQYYCDVFEEIYRDFMGRLPEGYDILNSWISNCSLGETHSVTMCFIMGCSIFLSDDKGAGTLADILMRKRAFNLNVYNREAAIQRLKALGNGLNKKERNIIRHKAK